MKPIMFVGTASDVGKSTITAGFCRLFLQDGYNPAPFKAQNMSLNSYATPEGFEIGRAQAVQAEAAGIACHTDMNPVLLKPTSDQVSQVIVDGKVLGNQTAFEYFNSPDRNQLFQRALDAYQRLSARYHPIVIEGAGSISELNLKQRDITNMRIALHSGADTYLIADIDRGGVFGSIYGTIELLTPEERALIKGVIINKFRGDARLFDDGRKILEDLTKVPVLGVLPYFRDIFIEEEDSVSLDRKRNRMADNQINIAIVLLRRMSNFTDFAVLEHDSRVNVCYTNNPSEIEQADIIIIPGSKNTISDLTDLKRNGVAQAIRQAHKNKKTVIGICGGYQMLGQSVEDPEHVEGEVEYAAGLGLLPVKTVLLGEKTTQQCHFRYRGFEEVCQGYEIHMGETVPTGAASPLNTVSDQSTDGYWLNEQCWGTYMHGILDNATVVEDLLSTVRTAVDKSAFTRIHAGPFDYQTFKQQQYDRLADWLREYLDIPYVYRSLELKG
jgi:adenosylcobyric acid synthase